MILFLLGFSFCLNILFGFIIYNKFIPIFKCKGININKKNDIDYNFWGDI